MALGARQYGYLWWRLNDPQTPYIEGLNQRNFFYFVTGGNFKPLIFAFTPAQVLTERIPVFLSFMQSNLPVLSTIGLIGLFTGRIASPVRTFLLLYFLTNAFYAVNYNIPDIGGYFLANDLVTAVFAGVALERHVQWQLGRGRRWILAVLCLVPAIYFGAHYSLVNRSDSTLHRDGIENAVDWIGGRAVLLSMSYFDRQGILYYLLAEDCARTKRLYEVNFNNNLARIQAYLNGKPALPRFARKTIPQDLPLYAYLCNKRYIKERGFRAVEVGPSELRLCLVDLDRSYFGRGLPSPSP